MNGNYILYLSNESNEKLPRINLPVKFILIFEARFILPMTKIPLFLLCICTLHALAQADSVKAIGEITAFQETLNEEYKDPEESPLDEDDLRKFAGHDFFPINLDYRVTAKLTVAEGTSFFEMKTTTSRFATERIYGYVTFPLAGKEFRLPVYQSKDLMTTTEYGDYLFFPFTDETNGKQTYAGGRYIDLRIPKAGDELVIDFNMAYNPYCAYSSKYSCPLVPAENQMDIEVPAGVKFHEKEKSEARGATQGDPQIYTDVEVVPEFPGGPDAMAKFVRKHLTYPRVAIRQKIEGIVYVHFIVAPDGSISQVRTIKGISRECDLEAERVIALMPKWKPGQLYGENVFVRFVLPIHFKGMAGRKKQY